MITDSEFIGFFRRAIEKEIQSKKDDLSTGKLGNTVEEIALKATKISSQILGLQRALNLIGETLGKQET